LRDKLRKQVSLYAGASNFYMPILKASNAYKYSSGIEIIF